MDDPFKHYPLPPAGLTLLRQYRDTLTQMGDDMDALREEFQKRAEAQQAAHREKLRELWYQLAPLAGVDAEATWDNNDWHVETRYLDSGFGALTFYPQPKNPMAAMLGLPQQEDEPTDEPEGWPPGATVT